MRPTKVEYIRLLHSKLAEKNLSFEDVREIFFLVEDSKDLLLDHHPRFAQVVRNKLNELAVVRPDKAAYFDRVRARLFGAA